MYDRRGCCSVWATFSRAIYLSTQSHGTFTLSFESLHEQGQYGKSAGMVLGSMRNTLKLLKMKRQTRAASLVMEKHVALS